MTANGAYRNFLDLTDFEGDELREILSTARRIKESRNGVRRGEGPIPGRRPETSLRVVSGEHRRLFDVRLCSGINACRHRICRHIQVPGCAGSFPDGHYPGSAR